MIAIYDYASPSPSEHISNVRVTMRKFAQENRILFYENGDGIGADGATHMSMGFLGNAVDVCECGVRAVMSNMAIEAGGKCGLCAAGEKTREFLCTLRQI